MVSNDCDPELRLSLGSSQDHSPAESGRSNGSSANSEQKQQQITIFYNGRICVCDVTELRARAIISTAKREMDERMKEKNQHDQQKHQYQQKDRNESPPTPPPASSPRAVPPLLNQGLSMKRSLQRFLQKRKTRINAVSPYNYRHERLFSSSS